MTIEEIYSVFLKYPSVQTDSRKLKKGDLFFALKGPSFNGNEFAQKAIDAGAAYAIIDEEKYSINGKTILVNDVLSALQQLAKYHRQQFDIPFIAMPPKARILLLLFAFAKFSMASFMLLGLAL